MTIVYVSHEYPPQVGGGIGTYVSAMSHALAARGHRVIVLTVTPRRYPEREQVNGVEVVRLPLPIGGGPEPMATLRAWQGRADAVADFLHRLIAAEPVDVIEFPDYRGEGTVFLSATQPADRPLTVVRLHTPLRILNTYNASATRFAVLESFEEQAILTADRVVSPSAALERELRQQLPDMPAVALSPHPVDPLFLEAPPSDPPDTCEVLYVGRLEQRKGVEALIRAMPAFLDACPDAKLLLAGGDLDAGPAIPSMQAHLLELLPSRYRDRVRFLGRISREELVQRYRSARVCVFPSLFENFPNTCLEAMALGRVAVGTTNSGMAEMIEDGVHGAIARSDDVEHLAETLIRVFRMPPDDRRRMGAAARTRIQEAYHPDRVAEDIERLYGAYITAHDETKGETKDETKGARNLSPKRPEGCIAQQGPDTFLAPAVAVVIPCFNHGRYLRDAIDSVREQDWPNVECVVVDDGSTDPDTRRVLDKLGQQGVRVIRQENQGLSAARNNGVRATDAPFFVPLDADDRIAPGFISALLPPMLENPSLGYCYSHVRFIGEADGVWQCPDYDPRRLLVENLSVATAVVRRAAFDLVGGYRTDMVHGFEDWDFWIALLAVGYHGRCVPQPLFEYRKHAPGESMLDKTQRHRADMVRLMIEHHRPLFVSMLDVSLADKDAMFFGAHTEAWRLKQLMVRDAAGSPASPVEDPVYQSLLAQAELDYIENSRAWRCVQRAKRNVVYRMIARLRFGPRWDAQDDTNNPAVRLARIKNSRAYRSIQALKRNPIYRWYARRKYGDALASPNNLAVSKGAP